MGFNSAFKGLNWYRQVVHDEEIRSTSKLPGIRWYNLQELLL